jgi:hypothetical protein
VKRDTLPRYIMHRPAQSSGQFLVKVAAQHFGFTRGPTPWWRYQPDTPPLAFTDNFLDGAASAASKDRVGHFAKQFQFCHFPSRFASVLDDFGHQLQNLIVLFERQLRHPNLNRKPTRYSPPNS